MKNRVAKQRFFLAAVSLAVVLVVSSFTSCSKNDNDSSVNPDGSSPISLSANVRATTNTKAAVIGTTFPVSTDDVFRLTAFSGAAAPTVDWSAPYFNDIQVNSGAASELSLAPEQYYPANGDNVYFYGYAPKATTLTAGTALAAPIANYTITGQQDIMAAQVTAGIAKVSTGTQPQPEFAFTHKLMQVRFKIVKDASYEAGKKVTEISVKGVKTSAKLDIATGALTFDGAADQTLSLPIIAGTKDEIIEAGTEMDGCVMLEPAGSNGSITLEVIADGVTYEDIKVTLTGVSNGEAGTSHLITLTFKRGEVVSLAAITDWAAPVDKDIDIDGEGLLSTIPAIGDYYYSDGRFSSALRANKKPTGMIYYVNEDDPKKYKVMSLDGAATELLWSASKTYLVRAAMDEADGKANSAAIKAAFDDKLADVVIAEQTFEEAFPAAAYCYNYTGKAGTDAVGSWYLPAKNELQYLWCSYNGAPITLWVNGASPISVNTAAQAEWNNRMTAGGAINVIPSATMWTSTEFTLPSTQQHKNAWMVGFTSGWSSNGDKSDTDQHVRCVRDI